MSSAQWLAIDPGSNSCGVAIFEGSRVIETYTLKANASDPISRRLDIAYQLNSMIQSTSGVVVCEEPFLQGKAAHGMQRLLGYIELLTKGTVHFIHPMTVKKAMGKGTLDKEQILKAVSPFMPETLFHSIEARKAYDESDAIAVGLTYLIQKGEIHDFGHRKTTPKRPSRAKHVLA